MRVTSLGFLTDLALRVLEGAEVTDRGDYLVVRSPDNPTFWWGNFLLLAGWPGPGAGTLVIVADPAEGAIRVYRSCGFADAQGQFSFQRPAAG